MHRMLKRAAASAIPALLGLAISPATAMAAPHTSRVVAGPAKDGRAHERLVPHTAIKGIARLARFSWVPGSGVGAPANGILNFGPGDKSTGNHISGTGGSGSTLYRNFTGSETGATGTNGSQNRGNGAGANSTGNGAGIFILGPR
jgi:hypothetical protein